MFGECDSIDVDNTTQVTLDVEILHAKCYRILSIFYAAVLAFGILVSLAIALICYRRRKFRGEKNLIDLTPWRKKKGRQQVQLLLSRRLSINDLTSSSNDFEFYVKHSSDWDKGANIEKLPPFPYSEDEGLLFPSDGVNQTCKQKTPVKLDLTSESITCITTSVGRESSENVTEVNVSVRREDKSGVKGKSKTDNAYTCEKQKKDKKNSNHNSNSNKIHFEIEEAKNAHDKKNNAACENKKYSYSCVRVERDSSFKKQNNSDSEKDGTNFSQKLGNFERDSKYHSFDETYDSDGKIDINAVRKWKSNILNQHQRQPDKVLYSPNWRTIDRIKYFENGLANAKKDNNTLDRKHSPKDVMPTSPISFNFDKKEHVITEKSDNILNQSHCSGECIPDSPNDITRNMHKHLNKKLTTLNERNNTFDRGHSPIDFSPSSPNSHKRVGKRNFNKESEMSDKENYTLDRNNDQPDYIPSSPIGYRGDHKRQLTISSAEHNTINRNLSLVEFLPNSPDRIKIDGAIWKTRSNE
ncbi:unnamed protein product [Mytilus coruscus]|uniref:Uncharacterized protein n=1 Tax=Mytilus coruscus TaxID=42192 RepID=A0A6J8C8W3_MYTCO|nr:unnamed protein product [Mytilus coruscus]